MEDPEKGLGSGSLDDPYVVEWYPNDPDDPYNWADFRKWIITAQVCIGIFNVLCLLN